MTFDHGDLACIEIPPQRSDWLRTHQQDEGCNLRVGGTHGVYALIGIEFDARYPGHPNALSIAAPASATRRAVTCE